MIEADRYAWIYVRRLNQKTTEANLLDYLKRNNISGQITCEKLNYRGFNVDFMMGFRWEHLEKIKEADFWLAGVIVQPF